MDSDSVYIPIADKKRHPALWLDDGNVILTTNISRFRVHRSLLSMHSPVFADMFSMPQPDTDSMENGFDGLPVVEISDNDTDFMHLLCFVYDHRYYQGGMETTFEKISGLLRMSTKYQMDDLRNEILSHLALAYPSTYKKYTDAVDTTIQAPLFPPFRGQHFAVVALGRETDSSILLPAAMWRSTCMTTKDIMDSTEDSTGTKHILSPADAKLCILKKSIHYKKLVQVETTLATAVLNESNCVRRNEQVNLLSCCILEKVDLGWYSTGGEGVSPCVEIAMSKVVHHFSSSGPDLGDDFDLMTRMGAFEVWRLLVCNNCRNLADSRLFNWQTGLWDILPRMFDLPPWTS